MRSLIAALFVTFAAFEGRAQNIILNPSFEAIDTALCDQTVFCDYGIGGLAEPWICLVANPDILTPCHFNGVYDNYAAPTNQYGYQKAVDQTNYTYVGFEVYWYNYREFISQPFFYTLEAGVQYCLSMWISSPDREQYYSDCLEAYFSNGYPDTTGTNGYLIGFTPQVRFFEGSVFKDTANWQHVTASFTASGDENTISIGCFSKDEDVITEALNPTWEYGTGFYIDAIALYRCDAAVFEAEAGKDTSICIGESLVLGSHDLPQYEYLWLNEQGDTLSHEAVMNVQPTQTSTYTLQVTDFKFDVSTDDITVIVDECNYPLFVPNIFSPNGDGQNDVLYVRGEQIQAINQFIIYNRWGEEIFACRASTPLSMTSLDCGWDGTFDGQQAPVGVYAYYAEAVMKSGAVVNRRGNVMLVR